MAEEKRMTQQKLSPGNAQRLLRRRSLGSGGPPWARGQQLSFSPDSRWLASLESYGQQRLRCWALSDAGALPRVSLPVDVGSGVLMLAGARVLTTTYSGLLQEWSAEDGTLRRESRFKGLNGLTLGADKKTLLLTGGGGEAWLWDVERWQLVRELEPRAVPLYQGDLSPDGRWAVAGAGNLYQDIPVTLRVWDVATGALHREVPLPGPCAWSAAFHPSEPRVVVGAPPHELLVVDTLNWQVVRQMEAAGSENLCFSPDGGLLLGGGTGFSVLDFQSGAALFEHSDGNDEQSSAVAFSPDGQWIAWGQGDGAVGLWGAE